MKTENTQTTTQKSLFLPLVVTLDNYETILDDPADEDLYSLADELAFIEDRFETRAQIQAYMHRSAANYREVASNYKVNLHKILAWDLAQTLKALDNE